MLNALILGFFVIGIVLLIVYGSRYLRSEGVKKKYYANVFKGLTTLMIIAYITIVMVGIIMLGKTPSEIKEITVKETEMVETAAARGNRYYSCEIIDEKTNELYVLNANSEREAKAYCLLFEKGDTYKVEMKWMNSERTIMDFEKNE